MSMIHLSVLQSKKFFSRVVFVTDSIGAARAKEYEVPFDEIRIEFDELRVDSYLWALPKLLALKSVYLPKMMHIDNDLVLWEDPAIYWKDSDLLFQNPEVYSKWTYYHSLFAHLQKVKPEALQYIAKSRAAYNCGVIGIQDPKFMDLWLEKAEWIYSDPVLGNREVNPNINLLNLIFEQSIVAGLCYEKGIKPAFLLEEITHDTSILTHLWSNSKRSKENMDKVKLRLAQLKPTI